MSKTRYKHPADNQSSSWLLGGLPQDARSYGLYPQCTLATLGTFARTSQKAERETAFLRLQSASINAAPEFLDENKNAFALVAIAILKKHPDKLYELLFTKSMVKDHYGREIWASSYQLFLGAGDVWASKQIHEEIISLIPDKETGTKIQQKAQAQFLEWFPNYEQKREEGQDEEVRLYDDRNKRQIADIAKQLNVVKGLINADPFTNNAPLVMTQQAVEVLCQLFKPAPGEVIRSGLHFPLAIMKEIYKVYDELQKGHTFFSLSVIYPALDALSTVDGQCCRYGLENLNMETGPARRCNPAFKHPIGQPLQVMWAADIEKRIAVLVDPVEGDICFSSGDGSFSWFNKNGALGRGGECACFAGWGALGVLCRTKAETICRYYEATPRNAVDSTSVLR
jgi:hypothetical protein